jgi:hypothetical protein
MLLRSYAPLTNNLHRYCLFTPGRAESCGHLAESFLTKHTTLKPADEEHALELLMGRRTDWWRRTRIIALFDKSYKGMPLMGVYYVAIDEATDNGKHQGTDIILDLLEEFAYPDAIGDNIDMHRQWLEHTPWEWAENYLWVDDDGGGAFQVARTALYGTV